jgi:hypothetical protein
MSIRNHFLERKLIRRDVGGSIHADFTHCVPTFPFSKLATPSPGIISSNALDYKGIIEEGHCSSQSRSEHCMLEKLVIACESSISPDVTLDENASVFLYKPLDTVQKQHGLQSLAKIPRADEDPNNRKQKNVPGSMFRFGSSVPPGSAGVASHAVQNGSVERGLNDEDALDRIFNTVERYSCPFDNSVATDPPPVVGSRRMQRPAVQESAPPATRSFIFGAKEPSVIERFTKHDQKNRDVLDSGFTKIDRHDRSARQNVGNVTHVTAHKQDALDNVFETVERYTCSGGDMLVDPHIQRDHLKPRSNPHRLTDRLGHTADALYGREGDVLDSVFGSLEQNTCGHPSEVYQETHRSTLLSDMERQNSLVASGFKDRQRYDSSTRTNERTIRRQPSRGNSQPRQGKKQGEQRDDMFLQIFEKVDYVIQNIEDSTTCR